MATATNNTSGGQSKKAPIRVKQDMIDFIKTQGMTRALKRAGEINAKGTKGEAEFIEGVRRMYGARRLSVATKTATPKKGSYQAGSAKSGKATYTTGSGVSRPTAKPAAKPAAKGMSNSTKAKIAGGAGAVAAGAVLLASRGKAGGLAAKLSPGLAKSGVGRAVLGGTNQAARKASDVKMMAKDKALSASGRAAAAAKRPVSQSQYDAMSAAAKRRPKTSTRGR